MGSNSYTPSPEWSAGWQAGFDDVSAGRVTIEKVYTKIKDGKEVYAGQLSGIRATAKMRDNWGAGIFGNGYAEGWLYGLNRLTDAALPDLCKKLGIEYIDYHAEYLKKNGINPK